MATKCPVGKIPRMDVRKFPQQVRKFPQTPSKKNPTTSRKDNPTTILNFYLLKSFL
tara:strand:- start:158 stop:325 length:168 start_codon:yes stop_codon:yes gene_type:complete